MLGKTNAGGSGGTGGTLTVTAPADVTVTATNEALGKTYTRMANYEGIATFKGLASGIWMISIDDDSHEPSTPVSVEIVSDFAISVSFFTAYINITYPELSYCKATDGVTELYAPDTTGVWNLTVPNAGTWVISCSENADGSGDSSNDSVEITEEGQIENVTLSYWNGELYDAGNEYELITGGLNGYPFYYGGKNYTSSNVTKNSDSIQFSVSSNGGAASFANKFNLDGFSSLNIDLTNNTFGGNRLFLYLTKERDQEPVAVIDIGGKTGIASLSFDSSALSEEVYIGLGGYAAYAVSYSSVFKKMWLS